MQEMPRDERHVDIARFADWLAVVERLEHGEEPAMALHHARERVQMPCPPAAAQREPAWLRGASGGHRGVDIGRLPWGDRGEPFSRGGRVRHEALSAGRRMPRAADEMPEARLMLREPGTRRLIVLGCGTVFHR